jgi:periplasmic divalent cation tolerance protein
MQPARRPSPTRWSASAWPPAPNRLSGIRSTYRWHGEVTTDSEELLLIKTTIGHFEALKARLLQLHPYELPELIAVPVTHGHEAYLDWVRADAAG